ncbi:hypothetical protein ARMGADRAFT_1080285 [Armillaria gallica]|uniref:Uncharacterized protein n=1 Tax=Armillaria gallica TaxID=47427 RepID=A0A2H3DQJ4_ARMGA|nr:hypothetical protein ARMGADRAFT_1080285 [Armillaria gallica]
MKNIVGISVPVHHSANADVSTVAPHSIDYHPKRKHESSSSMAPVNGSSSTIPHNKPFSGMLQVITDINRLKVQTLSRIIFVLYSRHAQIHVKISIFVCIVYNDSVWYWCR